MAPDDTTSVPTAHPTPPTPLTPKWPVDEPCGRLLKFFQSNHLPQSLQKIAFEYKDLAEWSVANVPPGPERTAGLRKLLEAKDCMVRAQLP